MDKELLLLEFMIKSTVVSLYNFISTPSGLAKWFCDKAVQLDDNTFALTWSKSEQTISVEEIKSGREIRYDWGDGNWFVMRIDSTELTSSVSLVISECVDKDDVDDAKTIWDHNIKRLRTVLGTGG